MNLWVNANGWWFLADGADPAGGPGPGFVQFLLPLMLCLLAYFMIFLPERQRKKRFERLSQVKEKDHVVTVGGIYGVVINVNRDQGRVTLRIDETSGTKIKIALTAIAEILGDNPDGVVTK